MRVMALDWGQKRIGVALSVEGTSIAGPLTMLPNDRRLLDRIEALVKEHVVDQLVVGIPLRMDGTLGASAQAARELAQDLKARGFCVHLWDERLTSRQAERLLIHDDVRRKHRRQRVDQVAAALILQSFLDSREAKRHKKGGDVDNG